MKFPPFKSARGSVFFLNKNMLDKPHVTHRKTPYMYMCSLHVCNNICGTRVSNSFNFYKSLKSLCAIEPDGEERTYHLLAGKNKSCLSIEDG